MKGEIREFVDLDFLESVNKKFEMLGKVDIDSLTNLFILGREGSGRMTRVRIMLSKIFNNSGVFKLKYKKALLGKKHDEFNYLQSVYHIEIDLKMNVNVNDKDIYEFFLKEFLETKNILINKLKVVVIKSFELASEQFQKSISSLIERNYLTSKFIIISDKRIYNLNLKSKIYEIVIGAIKKDDIINYLKEYSTKNGFIIYDEHYEDIIETCKKNDGYYNLKNIFALFEMATISKRYCNFYNSYNVFIDNILEKIMKKNFKFNHLSTLRSDLYDLYTSTQSISDIIKYIYKKMTQKFKDIEDFCCEFTRITNDIEKCLKISNKDIIHLERYILAILTLKNKYSL